MIKGLIQAMRTESNVVTLSCARLNVGLIGLSCPMKNGLAQSSSCGPILLAILSNGEHRRRNCIIYSSPHFTLPLVPR